MTIRSVALVVHPAKPEAGLLAEKIEEHLGASGVAVSDASPDLVVSIGGDGTMLRAAHAAHRADALLLGVNMGTLGYLTEIDAPDSIDALDRVLKGDLQIEERMMLECRTDDPAMPEPAVCLNEVLLERAARHRLVRVNVRINDERLASINADGVIVATPTGSTAYALSAGGPIVSPRASVLVVVPVSPHMIFSRPFVLAPDDVVELTVEGKEVEASLSLDGFVGCVIKAGSKVEVHRHERPLRLVRVAGPGFIERLRTKLGLPG